MNHNQTVPMEVVKSWSIMVAIYATKVHKQTRLQTIKVVTGGKRAENIQFQLYSQRISSDKKSSSINRLHCLLNNSLLH